MTKQFYKPKMTRAPAARCRRARGLVPRDVIHRSNFPFSAAGKIRRLLASKSRHTVEFQLAMPRNCDAGDALDAFTAALAEQSGGLDGLSGG
ncbi:hypothetical protein [Burkholderia lata]|uniref:hypothetical protein n=1 Tax=Burkholderia lata (strain ATCC 17760 / DSM 23089 / LMG 22485 / NCIMB 9086 / R18194 / 383) TaxID=482957 RepID=UPI00399BEBBB